MAQTFNLLTPADVRARWNVIRVHLDRAVQYSRGECQVDDLLPQVEEGRTGIFALEEDGEIKLALSFEVVRYPRRTVLFIGMAGGKGARALAANYDKIEAVAKQFGADAVRTACRPEIAASIQHFFPDVECSYQVLERKVSL